MDEDHPHNHPPPPHSCGENEHGEGGDGDSNTNASGAPTMLTKNQKKRLKEKHKRKALAQAQAQTQTQTQSPSQSAATTTTIDTTGIPKPNQAQIQTQTQTQGRSEPLATATAIDTTQIPATNGSLESFVESQQVVSHAVCAEAKEDPISILAENGGTAWESPLPRPLIEYVDYVGDQQLQDMMRLIAKDLSEPYSAYTYRYFLHNWPNLCILAKHGEQTAGVVVCKAERERGCMRGYIAMLTVDAGFRKLGIGSTLVSKAIERMAGVGCDEVVLEAEVCNKGALALYEKLGFMRDERLSRYYLNGGDAFRLKLWIYRDQQLTPALKRKPNSTHQPQQKLKSKATAQTNRKSSGTSTPDPARHVR